MKNPQQNRNIPAVIDGKLNWEHPDLSRILKSMEYQGYGEGGVENYRKVAQHEFETDGRFSVPSNLHAQNLQTLERLIAINKNIAAQMAARFAKKQKIELPPGMGLHAVSDFLFSKKTMERIVLPLIADLQDEHAEALSEGRSWKARWVRVRYLLAYINALGLKRLLAWVVGLFAPTSAG